MRHNVESFAFVGRNNISVEEIEVGVADVIWVKSAGVPDGQAFLAD